MKFLVRFEETCAAVIEHAFARAFPSRLEPAQIARKLVATFEAARPGTASFTVTVHPSDFARLQPHRLYLEQQWAEMLVDLARNWGIELPAGAHVTLLPANDVVAGAVRIESTPASPATAAAAELSVRVIRGLPPGAVVSIDHDIAFGRAPGCDVVIADPRVSRRHAVIGRAGDEIVVRDEGSANGTFLNGKRITQAAVVPGDRIGMGDTELLVERSLP